MTEVPVTRARTFSAAPVLVALRPVWETAFRDPVRDGHVRIDSLGRTERHAARVGLVTLGGLLLSLLLADRWRSGDLLPIGDGTDLHFLPEGLLPVTLVTFLVAWLMLCWGALTSGWLVKVVVAACFLLVNATIALPVTQGDARAFDWGAPAVRICYFVVPGLVLLSLTLRFLPGRVARISLAVLRVLVALGLGGVFLTTVWIHTALVDSGFDGITQQAMATTMTELEGLILPLLYVAAVLVIDFALNAAGGAAISLGRATIGRLRLLIATLVAVKLWFVLLDELGEWSTYLTDRPDAVARTVVSTLALAAAVVWLARRPLTSRVERAKEVLLYASSVALVLPVIVGVLVVGASVLPVVVSRKIDTPSIVTDYPAQAVSDWGQPITAGLGLLVGLWLVLRGGSDLGREIGSGMLLMGAWVLPALLINMQGWEVGFSADLLDVLVTLGAAAYLGARWRRIDTGRAVTVGALVVFTWLAATKGDWISIIGAFLGLPAVILVVVGVLFSVLGDAGFTSRGGRVVPQGARVLLFVGYLVLSVTILHWVETTHAASSADFRGESAFYFIGIPWAAWVVGRKLVSFGREAEAEAETKIEVVR